MTCENCTDKTCLKTKKPCKEVEKILKDNGIWSSDWIRPKLPRSMVKQMKKRGEDKNVKWREIPFTSLPSIDRSKDPLMEDFREI